MSLSTAAKCPFLSRVPTSYLQSSGSSLNMYGQKCPVMSRLFHAATGGAKHTSRKGVSLGKIEGLLNDEQQVICINI